MRLDRASRPLRRTGAELTQIGRRALVMAGDAGLYVALGLIATWAIVVAGLPALMPLQWASWLTFAAVAVAPGFLLGDIIGSRLDLDLLERLALAFPLSIVTLALPGLTALLGHLTLQQLTVGWELLVALLIVAWAITRLVRRGATPPPSSPWARHEMALLIILIAAYIAMLPLLSLYKMDGDAYAVLAFTADALTGEPLNVTEPLLGTGFSPNVRMGGNQMLPLFHLWCHLSGANHVQLIGSASRAMLALWALLSTYTLGREAAGGRRHIGLMAVGIQVLVYLAAAFYRGDSVTVFFFERTNADKFTISVTMLPITLGLAIRYIRLGERATWVAAALCALAVSAVHALIAAMLAAGLASFGALHLLLNLRRREAWRRVIALATLVAIGMAIPLAQLAMTFDTPLAPTYPDSFAGWRVGERTFQLLPGVGVRGLDLYGPLPDLAEVKAEDANTDANPFLIWRFAANMRRKRLIIFDLDRYISDPALVFEPPYLLSLLLLPLLLWRLPSRPGAQMAVANSLAVLLLLFNPILTPILGAMAVPWLLWRFVWLLPYALVIALAADSAFALLARIFASVAERQAVREPLGEWLGLAALGVCALLLWPRIAVTSRELRSRPAGPVAYPTPQRLFARLSDETREAPAMVLADENLSVTIPAFVGNAHILAREVLTSELFPADEQDGALQRHIDQYRFFHSALLTTESAAILERSAARYVAVSSGCDLDLQMRAAPQWFEWLIDDAGYSLYAVRHPLDVTDAIEANTLMEEGEWAAAEERYRAALANDSRDVLAAAGLARVSRLQGHFEPAIETLHAAVVSTDSVVARFHLGQLQAERGEWDAAIATFTTAVGQAPGVPRLHAALGSACLAAGRIGCTEEQFQSAVDAGGARDAAWRLITLAGLWDQEGETERALALYDRAVSERPDWGTRLLLASVYQSMGEYERAEARLSELLRDNPLSADAYLAMASLLSARGQDAEALPQLEKALALQRRQLQHADLTHLALAQSLASVGRAEDARRQIDRALELCPYSAAAYTLSGNLHRDQGETTEAIAAYHRALDIDPRQVVPYIALSEEYRRTLASAEETSTLLEAGVEQNPTSAHLYLYLAGHLERQGDVPTAIAAYQRAVDLLQPDTILTGVVDRSRIHGRALAYARLAAAYEDQAQVDPAISYYRAAAAATSEAHLSVLLGDALRRRNDPSAAADAFGTAIERDPAYVDGYARLADLLQAQGDRAGALSLREQAAQAIAAAAEGESLAAAGSGRYDLIVQQPGVQRGSDETLAIAAAAYSAINLALDPSGEMGDAADELAALDGLARLYVDSGEIGLAIEVYGDEITYGETQGWSPSRLARYHANIGSLYLLEDEPEKALDAYRRAGELDPWSAAARVGMGNSFTRLGREPEALEQFRLAVEVAPGLAEARLALAAALDRSGDSETSLDIQREVAGAHPGNVSAARALGRAWKERGEWLLAEESLERALAVAPGKPEVYVDLAALYTTQARYREAEEALRSAIDLSRDDVSALLHLGDLMARLGRPTQAADAYQDALVAAPTDWRPYVGLAQVHQALGEVDAAAQRLEQAATVDSTATQPLLQSASLHLEQGRQAEAEAALRAAIERSPGDIAVRQATAMHYRARGLVERSLDEWRLAVEENPTSIEALAGCATELGRQGYRAEAEAMLLRAEAIDPAPATEYRTLAQAHASLGNTNRAMEWFQRATEAAPDDPTAWLSLGQFHARRGDLGAALPCLEEATRLAPAEGQAWTALGEALIAAGRSEDGVAVLERAVTVEPAYLPTYEPLMRAHLALEDASSARRVAEAAQAVAPGNYETHLLAAAFAESQGDGEAARAALHDAIARAPGVLEPYLRSTESLLRQGHYAEAIATGEQAARIWPAEWRLTVGLARADVSQGRVDQGIARLEGITTATASEPGPWIELAALYRDQNQPTRAEALLGRAVEQLPGDPAIRLELADLYESLARPDDALDQRRLAAEEHPQDVRALVAYTGALRAWGRVDEADDVYLRAEQVMDGTAAEYRLIATACEGRGRREEALAWLERAILRWPADPASWIAQGRALARAGRTDQALSALRRATRLAPAQGEAWHALGTTLLEAGRGDEALAALERAILVEPAYLPPYGALVQLYLDRGQATEAEETAAAASQAVPGSYQGDLYVARVLRHQGRWDEAERVLAAAVTKAPGVPEPRLALGELAWLQGHTERAITQYELAVVLRPGDAEASIALADLLLHLGDNEGALSVARRAVQAVPGSAALLLRQGRAERALGRFADAEATFQRAIAADPASGGPHADLGDLHQAQGRLNEAILDHERALEAEPAVAEYYLALSQLWVTQGRTDVALAVLHEGTTQVSDPSPLRTAASSLQIRQGDPAGALDSVQRGLAEGENAELLCALGAYHESQADYAQAEQTYRRAIALAPEEPSGHLALADLYLRTGHPQEAMAAYREAIALEPRDATLHLALGDALRLLGDLAGAADCYAQALSLSPTLIEAYCSLGTVFESQARWQEAEALYQKALSLAPTSGRLLIQYGGLMVQRGQIDRATELLEAARQVSPRAETFVARAIFLRLLGRGDEALQDLQAAMQIEPGSLETIVALGDLYLARGASGEAAQLYRQAVTLAPGAAEGHLRLASLALAQGRLAQAWEAFDAASRVEPAEGDPWVQLAQARSDLEDLIGAESAYRQAVDVAPLVSGAYAGLALVTQRRTGDRAQALAWLDRARQLGVDPALIERTMGQVYLRAGQSDQALAHFEAATQLETVLPDRLAADTPVEPASPEGHLSLAAYQLARGLPYAALEAVRTAEGISPRDPFVQTTYGDIYRALGQLALAEQRYRYAASLDATKPDAYLALAAMLQAAGRHDEAIAAYRAASARAPLDPTPLIGMGDVYADAGDYVGALDAYARAAALNPALPDPWLRRGDALLSQGDMPGAQEAFQRAQAIRPYASEPLLRLAGLWVKQEFLAQAEAYARRAISAEPRDANAHAQLAGILARMERRDEAIASYLAAIQIDPRQTDVYDHWIRLHEDIYERPFRIDLQRLADALAGIEAGPERDTLWARVLLSRGYYRLEGPSDRAKRYLDEAIAVDPAFADLYRQLALLYEARLEGRPALGAWYRYRYAAALEGEADETAAHIDMLQDGRIEAPADGALVSGVVEIVGTAAREGFEYYKLEYRSIDSDAWNTLGAPVHHAVEQAPLATWDTAGLAPGRYRLRLTVVDQTGNYGPRDEITVTVGG